MRTAGGVVVILLSVFFISGLVVFAGTTSPSSSHSSSGLAGQDGWYRSAIDVTVTSTDTESGVAELSYWMNSDTPTVTSYSYSPPTQFLNASFESVVSGTPVNWYKGPSGSVFYFNSSTYSHDGTMSAGIAFTNLNGVFYYWYNEPYPVPQNAGEQIEVSAWVRTQMNAGDTAYFQVWGENSSGGGDVLLATSNVIQGNVVDWHNPKAVFTVPPTTNYIHLRLGGVGSSGAAVYWDMIEVRKSGGTTEQVTFNYATEGVSTLHYFGKDFNNNIEAEKTASLKIDSIAPSPWQQFLAERSGCSHCYQTEVQIRDVISGLDVSTAEYRYYTEHNGIGWSGWASVNPVLRSSDDQPASDGYTDLVKIIPPEISFGDSAHRPFRLQYRICDMAGSCSTSIAYELDAPWMVTSDGSIFVEGDIYLPSSPLGLFNNHAEVASAYGTPFLDSATGWIVSSYTHTKSGESQMEAFLPEYEQIKTRATSLGGAALPSASGIYINNGNYTLNGTTASSAWRNANASIVVIIIGNLSISSDFVVGDQNKTLFIVEGNISVIDRNVSEMAGFFICTGLFNSDTTGNARGTLTVYGSVVALLGYQLNRDLGSTGAVKNVNTPAEVFVYQPRYLLDRTLNGYLNNTTQRYTWTEVQR